MRSRFFGASSYDDDSDEDEEMDLSGFVTSSETQPVVVERKRAPKPGPDAAGMGNAGPRVMPPPPMSDMGYSAKAQLPLRFEDSEGSPWNPLWASDNALLRKPAIASKSVGLLTLVGGGVYSVARRDLVRGSKAMAAGAALYLHPVLGWNHGLINNVTGPGLLAKTGTILTHAGALSGLQYLVKPKIVGHSHLKSAYKGQIGASALSLIGGYLLINKVKQDYALRSPLKQI